MSTMAVLLYPYQPICGARLSLIDHKSCFNHIMICSLLVTASVRWGVEVSVFPVHAVCDTTARQVLWLWCGVVVMWLWCGGGPLLPLKKKRSSWDITGYWWWALWPHGVDCSGDEALEWSTEHHKPYSWEEAKFCLVGPNIYCKLTHTKRSN